MQTSPYQLKPTRLSCLSQIFLEKRKEVMLATHSIKLVLKQACENLPPHNIT